MPELRVKKLNRNGLRLFAGGCVAKKDGAGIRETAHLHISPDDPHRGWSCFRDRNPRLSKKTARRSATRRLVPGLAMRSESHGEPLLVWTRASGSWEF